MGFQVLQTLKDYMLLTFWRAKNLNLSFALKLKCHQWRIFVSNHFLFHDVGLVILRDQWLCKFSIAGGLLNFLLFRCSVFVKTKKLGISTKQKLFETLDGENRFDKTHISYIPYAPWDGTGIFTYMNGLNVCNKLQVHIRYTEHIGEVGNATQWGYLMIKPPVI